MAEINIKPKKPCKAEFRVFDHLPHGWYANNSVVVGDCVPIYRNSGGGVSSDRLTDLPTAIEQSISHLNQRIAEAEKLKAQLAALLKYPPADSGKG